MPRIALFLLTTFLLPLIGGSKSDVDWNVQFDAARDLAKQTGKPLLIEYWANWCGPCKRMDRDVWPDPRVVELSRKFVCVSVDVDRTREAAERNQIRVLPTIVVADPWGETILQQEGFVRAPELASILKEVPADFSSVRAAKATLEQNPKDTQALCELGTFYLTNHAPGLCSRYYREALKSTDDNRVREELQLGLAVNEIRMAHWGDARKSLERFLKQYPESAKADQALLGLVVVHLRQRKSGDAQKRYQELDSRFHGSPAADEAARMLQNANSGSER